MVTYVTVFALAFLVLWGAFSISTDPLLAKTPAVIACFHKRMGHFTGVAHPKQCVVKGYRGFGKHFVTIPVQGMKWGTGVLTRLEAPLGAMCRLEKASE